MNLYVVKTGCSLFWPATLIPRELVIRGREGYVVDLDAPLEKNWCAGQMHKLDKADESLSKASAIDYSPALRAISAASKRAEQVKAEPAPAPLPKVDLPAKKVSRG